MYAFQKMPDASSCVNMGAGFPNEKDLPMDKFRDAMKAGLEEADSSLLQYGAAAGYESFRAALAGFLTKNYGSDDESEMVADDLFVTTGITVGTVEGELT